MVAWLDFCVEGYEAGFSSYFKKNASTISLHDAGWSGLICINI
jgi:hypothetical protein